MPAQSSEQPGTTPAGVLGLARASTSGTLTEGLSVNPAGTTAEVEVRVNVSSGKGSAVIGGGCCVELAVEYMPVPTPGSVPAADVDRRVSVTVVDSEGTVLRWLKSFSEGYHVKEGIIVTYPGATLEVTVRDAIARVRWCEVFSC